MTKRARAKVDLLSPRRLSGIYRNRCPGISEIPVPELAKTLSAIQWNRCPRITETRNVKPRGGYRLGMDCEPFCPEKIASHKINKA